MGLQDVNAVAQKNPVNRIQSELQEGIGLGKCRKCGCMKETVENLRSSVPLVAAEGSWDLLKDIDDWLRHMEPIKYACLGCDHCYPAAATNIFSQAFPEAAQAQSLSCAFELSDQAWPVVAGEYFAFCHGERCRVAVSTLASVELAERLAAIRPKELCIVGKTETENIGIEKVVKNTITNPTIRFLILAGKDPDGHHAGLTLLALSECGVDERMRVTGSPGRRPILTNVTSEEVEAFRKQVQVVNLIGCEDAERIVEGLKELSQELGPSFPSEECTEETKPVRISTMPIVQAGEATRAQMDRAGYFVIIPQQEKGIITVEHYSYDNRLLRSIQGKDARAIYSTIIDNGWVTQLSHAAYLGKELARAQLSVELGFKYVQDGT